MFSSNKISQDNLKLPTYYTDPCSTAHSFCIQDTTIPAMPSNNCIAATHNVTHLKNGERAWGQSYCSHVSSHVCQRHVGGIKKLTMWFAWPSVRALMFMPFSLCAHNHSYSHWCCKERSRTMWTKTTAISEHLEIYFLYICSRQLILYIFLSSHSLLE